MLHKLTAYFHFAKLFGSHLAANVWSWLPIEHFLAALIMAIGIIFTRYLFQFFATIAPLVCTGLAIAYIIIGLLKFISELFKHAKR